MAEPKLEMISIRLVVFKLLSNMKQYKFIAGVACSICVLLTGCSDDVIDNAISLPDGTPSELTLNCVNAVQSVPVQANGEWTATVVYDDSSISEDASQWIGLLNHSGQGNGSLNFVIDANNSNVYRSATIVLTSGDESLEYKVGQQPAGYGEDNEDIDMSMFGGQVPLGFGIRMRKPDVNEDVSNVLLNQVMTINTAASEAPSVKELVNKFDLRPSNYVSVDTTINVNSTLISKESAEASSRDILANLKVNVAYGMFKLNLNGNFRMFGMSSDSIFNFSAMTAPVKGRFRLQQGNINADLRKLSDNSDDDKTTKEDKQSARELIFSVQFLRLRDAIEKCVADGEKYDGKEQNNLYRKMKALDNSFGPAYISSAEVGGSAELNYLISYNKAADTLNIHGDLTIGLNSLLSLDVKASADYKNHIKSHLKECTFQYRIKGGSAASALSFGENLANLMKKDSVIDVPTVQNRLSQWSQTLKLANSTCVSYVPAPIWDLFSNKAAEQLMHFFWDRYPNNGNACPYTFDVRRIIEDSYGGF